MSLSRLLKWTCRLYNYFFLHAGYFFITVCPLQRTWSSYAGRRIKQYTIQVIPWTYYYLLHILLLAITLGQLSHSYTRFNVVFLILYPFVFIYTCFKLFWLTFLGVQLTNSSLIPVLYPPEADMQRFEKGVFEDMTNWTRDSKSEVVPGVELKFHSSFLPDKSMIICGTIGDRFLDVMKPLEDNEILREKQLKQPVLMDTPLIAPSVSYDSNNDPSIEVLPYMLNQPHYSATPSDFADELIISEHYESRRSGSNTVVEGEEMLRRRLVQLDGENQEA